MEPIGREFGSNSRLLPGSGTYDGEDAALDFCDDITFLPGVKFRLFTFSVTVYAFMCRPAGTAAHGSSRRGAVSPQAARPVPSPSGAKNLRRAARFPARGRANAGGMTTFVDSAGAESREKTGKNGALKPL